MRPPTTEKRKTTTDQNRRHVAKVRQSDSLLILIHSFIHSFIHKFILCRLKIQKYS